MENLKKKIAEAFAKALAIAAESDKERFDDAARYYKDNISDPLDHLQLCETVLEAFDIASNGSKELKDSAYDIFIEEISNIPQEDFVNAAKEQDESEKSEEQSEEESEIEKTPMKIATRIFIAVVLVLIAVGVIWVANHFASQNDDSDVKTSVSNTTWQMSASDYGQNRWFADGIQEIKDAKTDAEAADAAMVWLEKVKTDPALLAGAAQYFLKEDVDSSTLVKDGWATQEAVLLYSRLGIAIGMAKVDATEAPADGINSGVSNGEVVQAAQAGISGDRKAVRATLDDGTVIYIMGRCGNPVTTSKTTTPEGPTDQTTTPDWIGDGTPNIVPKSSDPDDYKKPGDDNKKDSGKGTKPLVPEVTKKAESSAPAVDSSVKLNDEVKITEKVTKDPGDETAITAKGAKIADEERNSTNIPDAEDEVNPGKGNNGTNEETVANPF